MITVFLGAMRLGGSLLQAALLIDRHTAILAWPQGRP